MAITAKVIADSISPAGKRITTMQLRYPRFIHAEELTHRVLYTDPEQIIIQTIPDGLMYDENLSRNASSSRATPVNRVIQDVLDDPAIPVSFGKNQRGMQAAGEHDAPVEIYDFYSAPGSPDNFDPLRFEPGLFQLTAEQAWLKHRDQAVEMARAFAKAGYHKQVVNRLLEPFAHINVVVTATEWANFFGLRNHPDAEPNIQVLASAMKAAMGASLPIPLQPGEWHLPYITDEDRNHLDLWDIGETTPTESIQTMSDDVLVKVSVARCARVSYLTHDGRKSTVEEDLALYDRLLAAQPLHASPAEHQATPDEPSMWCGYQMGWRHQNEWGNFVGWRQYRKTLPGECIRWS